MQTGVVDHLLTNSRKVFLASMQKDRYHEEKNPTALGNQKWGEASGAADPPHLITAHNQ